MIISEIKNNLREVLYLADAETWEEGENWYRVAREWCSVQGNRYGYSWDRVAAIVAVLSPQLRWNKNLETAEAVLSNKDTVGILQNSLRKAYAIVDGTSFFELVDPKRSPKVYNFYLSILGSPISACIDSHMYRAAYRMKVYPTYRRYQDVAFVVRRLGREIGVPATTLQAIIWCTVKSKGGN